MVGITETPTSISAVYAIKNGTQVTIKAQQCERVGDLAAKQRFLTQFVTDNSLQGVLCSYVLEVGEYSLNLFDAPAVPKEEVHRAVRWLLRENINFPIEDAIIDTFELPFARAKDNGKMLYAVAIRKELISKIENLIAPTGLVLSVIDIPELVLKNVVNRHPQQLKGCAFIQLSPTYGKLILCREEQICITRSFELKLEELGQDQEQDSRILEALALEVQRSFDYINSVFRQNIPNIIILAPTGVNKEVVQNFLKSNLGAEVYCLKMAEHFTFEKPLKEEEEAEYLLAAGVALRQPEAAA